VNGRKARERRQAEWAARIEAVRGCELRPLASDEVVGVGTVVFVDSEGAEWEVMGEGGMALREALRLGCPICQEDERAVGPGRD
jgi:hypothetical protein